MKANLEKIRYQIETSCKAMNKETKEVTLIAVSKTKPVELLKEAYKMAAVILEKIKYRNLLINMINFQMIFVGI